MSEFTLKTAEKYLEIDITELETEVATHSVLVDRVSDQYAHAIDRRDHLKKEVKELEATLAIKIRRISDKSDKKITDVTLARMVLIDEDYMEKNDEYLEACLEVGLWEAKREGYKARTSMLSNSTSLFLGGIRSNMVVKSKNAEDASYESSKRRMIEMKKNNRKRIRSQNNEEE
jgi:hypothetical protein